MSRAAIFDAITGDTALNLLGITEDSVFQNFLLRNAQLLPDLSLFSVGVILMSLSLVM